MPLDDHEQSILDEIERQFYEQDPDLAHAVRNIDRTTRFGIRVPAAGTLAGIAVMLLFFTVSTVVALVGFVITVVSATALVQGVAARSGARSEPEVTEVTKGQRMFRRFRRS
jgi:hypothetical protein